jgi:hypothetical protein
MQYAIYQQVSVFAHPNRIRARYLAILLQQLLMWPRNAHAHETQNPRTQTQMPNAV